jgi:hypothetical protein
MGAECAFFRVQNGSRYSAGFAVNLLGVHKIPDLFATNSGPIPRMVRLSVSLWFAPPFRKLPSPLCSIAQSVELRMQNKRVGLLGLFIDAPRIHRDLTSIPISISFDGATGLRSIDNRPFSRIVVPITSIKITPTMKLGISGKPGPGLGIGASFGTGFCLDPACHFIATNYHLAVTT